MYYSINLKDLTPPKASNPATVNVECKGDVPLPNISVVTDATDNCGSPSVAFVGEVSDGKTCPETITRTYSVTDIALNTITVTQTIIIQIKQHQPLPEPLLRVKSKDAQLPMHRQQLQRLRHLPLLD